MSRRLCLITGASAGIGAAFAELYAARGWDLALTGRRADRLEGLASSLRGKHGAEVLVLPADLADPATPQRLVAAVEAAGRDVDALVNNAGYGGAGFSERQWNDHAAFLQVMLSAPVRLAHLVLPGMRRRGYGRVVNVSSLAGFLPGTANDTLYGPVKSFLIRFSQGLHLETRGSGVHVSALCPGYTYSEFHDVTGSREAVSRAVPKGLWLEPDRVALAGFRAVEANRPVCVPGLSYKLAAALMKATPEDWVLEMTAWQARRMRSPERG